MTNGKRYIQELSGREDPLNNTVIYSCEPEGVRTHSKSA